MPKVIRLLDFKTGCKNTDYTAQLKGYAFLALQKYPHADSAYACIIWIRSQEVEGWEWSRADLQQWYIDLAERLKDDRYSPGSHCGYCGRSLTCPAHAAQLRRAVNALVVSDDAGEDLVSPNLTGTEYAALIERCKLVESLCDDVRVAVKARVAAAGGRMPTGDGRELVITQQQRQSITFEAGWDVLAAEGLCTLEVREAVTIPKAVVERAAMARAPRGQKTEAAKAIMAKLAEAGAVETKVIERLEIVRANQAIEEQETS